MKPAEPTLIHQLLERSARLQPDKVALVHEGVRVSYGQLNAEANRLARWLIGVGVLPGDRVVLLLENGREYVVSYYGILKAGAVAVPLSSELKQEGLEPLLAELEPVALIASGRLVAMLQAANLPRFGVKVLALCIPRQGWQEGSLQFAAFEDLTSSGDGSDIGLAQGEENLSSIIYTSGSTGKPKGVMLSHLNVVTNVASIVQYLDLTAADVQMVVLPFFYVMGKSLLNTHVAVGGTVVINNRFAFPATVVKQMIEEKVTGFSGVPSTYAHLLHRSFLRSCREQLGSLRYCSQAGGHLPRALKEELCQALPAHTRLFVMYGATEASARLAYVEPSRLKEKLDSIGRPIPGVELKVLDPQGRKLPPGEVGELVAAGRNIMQGYWRDAESTARVLDQHGYHTGDLGYCDQDGYFFLVGRSDDLLKVGGHRINPQEIEETLMASGLLVEVAVIGVGDPLLGYRLVALAVARDSGTSWQELLRGCFPRLPRYKVPAEVCMVQTLPKNFSGKVDRAACVRMVEKSFPVALGYEATC